MGVQPDRDPLNPQAQCSEWHRRYCGAHSPFNEIALMMGYTQAGPGQHLTANGSLPYPEQDIASFLLVRGSFAWLGYGYQGCADAFDKDGTFEDRPWAEKGYGAWHPLLDSDFGEPVSGKQCHETSPGSGVFEREFTKATVSLDCKGWTAKFEFKN